MLDDVMSGWRSKLRHQLELTDDLYCTVFNFYVGTHIYR